MKRGRNVKISRVRLYDILNQALKDLNEGKDVETVLDEIDRKVKDDR